VVPLLRKRFSCLVGLLLAILALQTAGQAQALSASENYAALYNFGGNILLASSDNASSIVVEDRRVRGVGHVGDSTDVGTVIVRFVAPDGHVPKGEKPLEINSSYCPIKPCNFSVADYHALPYIDEAGQWRLQVLILRNVHAFTTLEEIANFEPEASDIIAIKEVSFIVPFAVSLKQGVNNIQDGGTGQIDVAMTANATTNSSTATQVNFTRINPDSTFETQIVPLTLNSAQYTFTPTLGGHYTILADFGNGVVVEQTLNISFNVVPESMIGTVALVASSLGGFVAFRRMRNNKSDTRKRKGIDLGI